ncbi:MAG: hypothetical protein P0S95_06165 [Rhabdochlamydiaceae bacterium]|nr:hypothetical protein [Candidatus Amphrikana amoebophyrae]
MEVQKDRSDIATSYLQDHHQEILPFLERINHSDVAEAIKVRIHLDKK